MTEHTENPRSRITIIFRESFKRFYKDRCDVEARSLSFITILLIVPFFLVSIFSLRFFKFYGSLEGLLIEFISNFFIPEKGKKIITYLNNFQYSTDTLNIFNISFVLLVSFWMFFMITRNVNRIWKSRKKVNFILYILKYIIFILITPALLIISFYLRNSGLIYHYFNLTIKYFRYGAYTSIIYSILINWLLVFLLYYFIPHGRVKFKYSIISAFIAAFILWITRFGYNFYFKNISQINIVYGSLSFIPVFLIWIYISWLIVLYGLELNYSFHFYDK